MSSTISFPSPARRIYLRLLRWWLKIRAWFEGVWRRPWFGWLLIVAFALLYFYWRAQIPSPGKAVAALAALAALLAFRPEAGGFEKFVCMVVIIAFLLLEFRSIDYERKETTAKESAARAEEARQFKEIGRDIEATIANSDRQFQATMGRTNSILTSITGGQAYLVVLPILITPAAPDVPIAAENHGQH